MSALVSGLRFQTLGHYATHVWMTLVSFKYKSGPKAQLVLDLSCHQSDHCILITSTTRDDNQTHRTTDVTSGSRCSSHTDPGVLMYHLSDHECPEL